MLEEHTFFTGILCETVKVPKEELDEVELELDELEFDDVELVVLLDVCPIALLCVSIVIINTTSAESPYLSNLLYYLGSR